MAIAKRSCPRKATVAVARKLAVIMLLEIPEGPGRYKCIADCMNGRGSKTFRGGVWTDENVRKQLKRGKKLSWPN